MHRVSVDEVTLFDIPVYASRLIDEIIYGNQVVKNQKGKGVDESRKYVIFCLRHRGVVDDSFSDEDISKNMSLPLLLELFDLFWYGVNGKPEEWPLEEDGEKKKSTGANSSGNSSSTTPTSQSSAQKTLVSAQ